MHAADRARTGIALLEVLVAMTILGTAGLALISLAIDAARAVRHAAEGEAEFDRASAFVDHVALWDVVDLDRHLGEHAQGAWRLEVSRPEAALYVVRLRDSTGRHLLLGTTLYRPDVRAADTTR